MQHQQQHPGQQGAAGELDDEPPLAWGGESPRFRPGSLLSSGAGLLGRLSNSLMASAPIHAAVGAGTADLETPLLPGAAEDEQQFVGERGRCCCVTLHPGMRERLMNASPPCYTDRGIALHCTPAPGAHATELLPHRIDPPPLQSTSWSLSSGPRCAAAQSPPAASPRACSPRSWPAPPPLQPAAPRQPPPARFRRLQATCSALPATLACPPCQRRARRPPSSGRPPLGRRRGAGTTRAPRWRGSSTL